LFRLGEACSWKKFSYKPGETLTSAVWLYKSSIPSAFEVNSISWQLFSKNSKDLDQVLWQASLCWRFSTGLDVAIGPLTQHTGSIGDQLFPEDRGNMERLAETGNGLPSEEMWRILTQGGREGDMYRFGGKMTYLKHPVMIPSSAECEVRLNLDEPVTFEEEFRFRVILHGVFKNVIEVA